MAINEGRGATGPSSHIGVDFGRQTVVPLDKTKQLLSRGFEARNSYNPLTKFGHEIFKQQHSKAFVVLSPTPRPTLEPTPRPTAGPDRDGAPVVRTPVDTPSRPPVERHDLAPGDAPKTVETSARPLPTVGEEGPRGDGHDAPPPVTIPTSPPSDTRQTATGPGPGPGPGKPPLTKEQEQGLKALKETVLPMVEKLSPTVKAVRVAHDIEKEAGKVLDAGQMLLYAKHQERMLDRQLMNHEITVAEHARLKPVAQHTTQTMKFEAYRQLGESGYQIGKTLLDASPLGDAIGVANFVLESLSKPQTPGS